jgi:hypothetical protein
VQNKRTIAGKRRRKCDEQYEPDSDDWPRPAPHKFHRENENHRGGDPKCRTRVPRRRSEPQQRKRANEKQRKARESISRGAIDGDISQRDQTGDTDQLVPGQRGR